jgi:hypothetical protein
MAETNRLADVTTMSADEFHAHFNRGPSVAWNDKALKRFVRVRLITDPGFPMYDVSYVYGELWDGTPCTVILPFWQVPKRNMMKWLIAEAKKAGVYLKGKEFFSAMSTLT